MDPVLILSKNTYLSEYGEHFFLGLNATQRQPEWTRSPFLAKKFSLTDKMKLAAWVDYLQNKHGYSVFVVTLYHRPGKPVAKYASAGAGK